MKKLHLLIFCGLGVAVATATATARVFEAADPTKQADISNQIINPKNLDMKTLSSPVRSSTAAPLTKGDLKMKGTDMKNLELKTLDLSSVPMSTLPQQNFEAKRAAAGDKMRDEKQVKTQSAKIKDRQIRAFTPAGEAEMKDQFHHLP